MFAKADADDDDLVECPECGDRCKPGAGLAAHRRFRHNVAGKGATAKGKANDVEPGKDIAQGIRKFSKGVDQPDIADAIDRRADEIADAVIGVVKATQFGTTIVDHVTGEDNRLKVALIKLGVTVAPIVAVSFMVLVLPRFWPRRRPLVTETGERIIEPGTENPLSYSNNGDIWAKGRVIGNLSDQTTPIPT